MADALLQGEGGTRLAEALLRSNGGRVVKLRVPAPASSGDDTEQLGLATPEFQDVELAPAVFRKVGSTATLLVSACAVKSVVGMLTADSVESLFATVAGVLVDHVLFAVTNVVAEQANGAALAYAVSLRAPAV